MNPIKNVFNYIKTKLYEESLNGNITFENLEKYSAVGRNQSSVLQTKGCFKCLLTKQHFKNNF